MNWNAKFSWGQIGSFGLMMFLFQSFDVSEKDFGNRQPPALEEGKNYGQREVAGITFVWIPGGTFLMGNDESSNLEWPAHKVRISGFWFSQYEVTQKDWLKVMGENPSQTSIGEQFPVESVKWQEIKEFMKKFSDLNKVIVRLPTEAEWEYAARGGTTTDYFWGNEQEKAFLYSNFGDKNFHGPKWAEIDQNDGFERTSPVGSFKPNGYGLFDVLGNVSEWTMDYWDTEFYYRSPRLNPLNSQIVESLRRIMRGGSYGSSSLGDFQTTTRRGHPDHPKIASDDLGFRILLVEEGITAEHQM